MTPTPPQTFLEAWNKMGEWLMRPLSGDGCTVRILLLDSTNTTVPFHTWFGCYKICYHSSLRNRSSCFRHSHFHMERDWIEPRTALWYSRIGLNDARKYTAWFLKCLWCDDSILWCYLVSFNVTIVITGSIFGYGAMHSCFQSYITWFWLLFRRCLCMV